MNRLLFLLCLSLGLSACSRTEKKLEAHVFVRDAVCTHTPVLNQGRTSTCWAYASASLLESDWLAGHPEDTVRLSPMYMVRQKYLNQFELHLLLSDLDLQGKLNWDWMILLIAKTGIRFSEALAITPADFDFSHQMLSINKTWDYKGNGGFLPTKNKSSVRKIQIDWQTVIQFAALVKDVPEDKPIFVFKEHAYNSTVNDVLERHCNRAKIPVISVHGLRHTHASVLLFAGVSIASVARRLGHSSMTTTQKTYLHIIQELENQDIDLVMRSLSGLS